MGIGDSDEGIVGMISVGDCSVGLRGLCVRCSVWSRVVGGDQRILLGVVVGVGGVSVVTVVVVTDHPTYHNPLQPRSALVVGTPLSPPK